MPRNIRIVIWNIQEFGRGGNKYAARGDYTTYCDLLAYVLVRMGADVLIMQELTPDGLPHLDTLRDALNERDPAIDLEELDGPRWWYDYIPGSLTDQAQKPYTKQMLGWLQRAHYEGYALFWKQGHDFFDVLTQRHNLSEEGEIGLIFEGRLVREDYATADDRWFYAPRYSSQDSVRYDLRFTANDRDTTDTPLLMDNCRRPCYCLLELNLHGEHFQRRDQLLPIVVFHSPVAPKVRRPGVQLASLSQPFYLVDDPSSDDPRWFQPSHAIFGGDFNVNFQPNLAADQRLLRAIQHDFVDALSGYRIDGAQLPDRLINTPTMCGWRTYPHNHRISSDDVNDYAQRCIDHIFVRPSQHVTMTGGVLNLVQGVMQNGGLVSDPEGSALLKRMGAMIEQIRTDRYTYCMMGPTGNRTRSAPCLGSKDSLDDNSGVVTRSPAGLLIPYVEINTDYLTIRNELERGYFTTPLAATQFIQELISDHFPTLVQVTIQ